MGSAMTKFGKEINEIITSEGAVKYTDSALDEDVWARSSHGL
jgi:hypothetical protein